MTQHSVRHDSPLWGKDVATLNAEMEQAAVRLALRMKDEAAKLVRSPEFQRFVSDTAHARAGHRDEPAVPAHWPGPVVELAKWLAEQAQDFGETAFLGLQEANRNAWKGW